MQVQHQGVLEAMCCLYFYRTCRFASLPRFYRVSTAFLPRLLPTFTPSVHHLVSLTSTTLRSKSKRSWSTAVASLANHVWFTLTLTTHGITDQRPIFISLGSRGITVTRYRQKQRIELAHSVVLCWGGVRVTLAFS